MAKERFFHFLFFFLVLFSHKSVVQLFNVNQLLNLPLKASHHGVCARSKCSHVHHPQADNGGIYDDYGVCFGSAKIYTSYHRKVNDLLCCILSISTLMLEAFDNH